MTTLSAPPAPAVADAYRECEQTTRREAANFFYGIRLLQKKIQGESITDDSLREEHLVGSSGLFLPAERVDELSEPFGNSVSQTRSG